MKERHEEEVEAVVQQKEPPMPYIHVSVSRAPARTLARTLVEGVTARTFRILRKRIEVTAVSISFVDPEQWFIGGQSLHELGRATFWLDIGVTDGTNSKDEKAAYLADIFAFMRETLGPLHEISYVRVLDVPAAAWGYGGVSQEERYVRAKLEAGPQR